MKKNIIILLSLLFIGSVSSSIYAQPPKLILQTGTYITSGMPNSYIYISNTGTGYGNSTQLTLYDNDINNTVSTGRIRINPNGRTYIRWSDGMEEDVVIVSSTKFGAGLNTWELKQY